MVEVVFANTSTTFRLNISAAMGTEATPCYGPGTSTSTPAMVRATPVPATGATLATEATAAGTGTTGLRTLGTMVATALAAGTTEDTRGTRGTRGTDHAMGTPAS